MATARDRSLTHRLLMLAAVLAGFNIGLIGMILAHNGTSPREAPQAAAAPVEVAHLTPTATEPSPISAAEAEEEETEADVRDTVQELSKAVSIPEPGPTTVAPDLE